MVRIFNSRVSFKQYIFMSDLKIMHVQCDTWNVNGKLCKKMLQEKRQSQQIFLYIWNPIVSADLHNFFQSCSIP